MMFKIYTFSPSSSFAGLDGCSHTDLLLLWSRPGVSDCPRKLQHLSQQRLQVCYVSMLAEVARNDGRCSPKHEDGVSHQTDVLQMIMFLGKQNS